MLHCSLSVSHSNTKWPSKLTCHEAHNGLQWYKSIINQWLNLSLDSKTSTTTSTRFRACAWTSIILAGKRDSLLHSTASPSENRNLTKQWRRRQRERQKSKKFNEQNNYSEVHHAFLYISLPSLHNCNVKWLNFELTWEPERQGDKFYVLSVNSDAVPSLRFLPNFPPFK